MGDMARTAQQPARGQYVDFEKLMTSQLVGRKISLKAENAAAQQVCGMTFKGRVFRMKHSLDNQLFLLAVEPSTAKPRADGQSGGRGEVLEFIDDSIFPVDGHRCEFKFPGQKRFVAGVTEDSEISRIANTVLELAISAYDTCDPDEMEEDLRERIAMAFPSVNPTDAQIKSCIRLYTDYDNDDCLDRIEIVVKEWYETGFDMGIVIGDQERDDASVWQGQRISVVCPEAGPNTAWFLVKTPLEPEEETEPGVEQRPLRTCMPLLDMNDPQATEAKFTEVMLSYLSDPDTLVDIEMEPMVSDRPLRALKIALSDIKDPISADKQHRPSPWAIATCTKWLLDFESPDPSLSVNLGEKFPWMLNPLNDSKHHLVDPRLLEEYHSLNPDQKELYRVILTTPPAHRLQFVNGVPGSGKTHFMRFFMRMAEHGEKNVPHKVKFLYVGPQNTHVTDMARNVVRDAAKVQVPANVIRLHELGSEKKFFKSSIKGEEKRASLFNADEANAALANTSLGDLFAAARCFSKLSADADEAKMRGRPQRQHDISLHEALVQYLRQHEGDHQKFLRLLDGLRTSGDYERDSREIGMCVDWLLDGFLKQAHGCICATPYMYLSSTMAFRKAYQPDIIFVDEGARVSEGDLIGIIRNADPSLVMVVGDVHQLPVFVSPDKSKEAVNPFRERLRMSTLHRAVRAGLNDTNLEVNERSAGTLTSFSSRHIYNSKMKIGRNSPADQEKCHVYQDFLREHFKGDIPAEAQREFMRRSNRAVVEIPTSYEIDRNGSKINHQHAKCVVDIAAAAVNDPALDIEKNGVLIISYYRTQRDLIVKELETRTRNRALPLEKKGHIEVRTLDSSQDAEADLVIIDLVRTNHPGFTADKNRLNVALTRARFADVVFLEGRCLADFKFPDRKTTNDESLAPELLIALREDAKKENYHVTVSSGGNDPLCW